MTAGAAARGAVPPTVLFVDDEEVVLHVLARQLRGQPYRVLTTKSPRGALDLIVSERVDILVSDIDMPEMSGLDLTTEARRRHPDVVRVLITGHASLSTAVRAINEGEVFRFLSKPWRPEELAEVLRAAVRRRLETPPRVQPPPPPERRSQRLAVLEREHPGLSQVQISRGVYSIDQRRLEELLVRLGPAVLGQPGLLPARNPTLRGLNALP